MQWWGRLRVYFVNMIVRFSEPEFAKRKGVNVNVGSQR